MRVSAVSVVVAALFYAHAADRDRYVTGSGLGAGSGKSTGGLADHAVPVMWPGGILAGTSGRCYAWTRSGRLLPARCPAAARSR